MKLQICLYKEEIQRSQVQAVESYRLWPEGPGFESRSSRIAQARVRLATDTLPHTPHRAGALCTGYALLTHPQLTFHLKPAPENAKWWWQITGWLLTATWPKNSKITSIGSQQLGYWLPIVTVSYPIFPEHKWELEYLHSTIIGRD